MACSVLKSRGKYFGKEKRGACQASYWSLLAENESKTLFSQPYNRKCCPFSLYYLPSIMPQSIPNILAKGVTSTVITVLPSSRVAVSLAIACADMEVNVNSLHMCVESVLVKSANQRCTVFHRIKAATA